MIGEDGAIDLGLDIVIVERIGGGAGGGPAIIDRAGAMLVGGVIHPDAAQRDRGRDRAEVVPVLCDDGVEARGADIAEILLDVRLEGGVAPEEIVLPSRAVRVPERAAAIGKDPAWLAAPTAH